MGPGRSSELPSIPSMNPSIWRRLSVSHRATHRIFPRVSGSTNTRRLSGPHQHPDRNKITHHLLIRILDSLCVRAKSLQSCLTLCNPTDCSLPGPSVHGILQAKILEWVAIHPPVDLPDLGTEHLSPVLLVDSLPSSYQGSPM